jgi:predicted TPR repeat methyltransferase
MQKVNTSILTNEFAAGYDTYISDKKWSGPKVIFELMKPFIKKNDLLLDLGIGTGLAAISFKNEGLKIYGIDSSEEMISVCKSKELADGLFLSDLSAEDFYFPDIEFDHIISNAFFHFIGDPNMLFDKVRKHLKKEGYFCFSTLRTGIGENKDYMRTDIEGILSWTNIQNGLIIFKHSDEYILNLLKDNKLNLISSQYILGFQDKTENKRVFFNIYLAQKQTND